MTRINLGIDSTELCDQHLLAEYRELPRAITLLKRRLNNGNKFNDIPKQFTLGTGHVKFFYNKSLYLQKRYTLLVTELLRRGVSISYNKLEVPPEAPNVRLTQCNYDLGRRLLQKRINERLKEMKPRWTKTVPPEWAYIE